MALAARTILSRSGDTLIELVTAWSQTRDPSNTLLFSISPSPSLSSAARRPGPDIWLEPFAEPFASVSSHWPRRSAGTDTIACRTCHACPKSRRSVQSDSNVSQRSYASESIGPYVVAPNCFYEPLRDRLFLHVATGDGVFVELHLAFLLLWNIGHDCSSKAWRDRTGMRLARMNRGEDLVGG